MRVTVLHAARAPVSPTGFRWHTLCGVVVDQDRLIDSPEDAAASESHCKRCLRTDAYREWVEWAFYEPTDQE